MIVEGRCWQRCFRSSCCDFGKFCVFVDVSAVLVVGVHQQQLL